MEQSEESMELSSFEEIGEDSEQFTEMVAQSEAIHNTTLTGSLSNIQFYTNPDETTELRYHPEAESFLLSQQSKDLLESHNKTADDLHVFEDSSGNFWVGVFSRKNKLLIYESDSIMEGFDGDAFHIRSLAYVSNSFSTIYTTEEQKAKLDPIFSPIDYTILPADPREFTYDEPIMLYTEDGFKIASVTACGEFNSPQISNTLTIELTEAFLQEVLKDPQAEFEITVDKDRVRVPKSVVETNTRKQTLFKGIGLFMLLVTIPTVFTEMFNTSVLLPIIWTILFVTELGLVIGELSSIIGSEPLKIAGNRPSTLGKTVSYPFRTNTESVDTENYHLLEVTSVSEERITFTDFDSEDTLTVLARDGILSEDQISFIHSLGLEEVASGQLVAVEIIHSDETDVENSITVSPENHTYSEDYISVIPFN